MHQSHGHAFLHNRKAQGQFKIYRQPGAINLADYFTKHHPPAHHVNMRAEYLTRVNDLADIRHTKLTDRPNHKTKLLRYKGVLDKLAYES